MAWFYEERELSNNPKRPLPNKQRRGEDGRERVVSAMGNQALEEREREGTREREKGRRQF